MTRLELSQMEMDFRGLRALYIQICNGKPTKKVLADFDKALKEFHEAAQSIRPVRQKP